MGAFLQSSNAKAFDRADHPWRDIQNGAEWLRLNNPLIRQLAPENRLTSFQHEESSEGGVGIDGLGLPTATLVNPENDAAVPIERPDIVVNPFDFELDVRNEDYRSHRLPAGTFKTSISTVKYLINHGDKWSEMLLFPHLYPNGKGAWTYRGPAMLRYDAGWRFELQLMGSRHLS